MNIMDECFSRRMDVLRERFPLQEFRRAFVEQFARKGLVYIQGITLEVDVMDSDAERGIIFSSQRNIDKALRLVRRWGFEVVERKPQGYTLCYQVMLPEDYLRRQMGSDNAGQWRTALRTLRHADSLDPETKEKHRKAFVI